MDGKHGVFNWQEENTRGPKRAWGSYPCLYFLTFYFIFFKLINLFLVALGLRCCVQPFSSCRERGLLFVAVCGLLIVVASLVAERGL